MDYDFFDRSFIDSARRTVTEFREIVEKAHPPKADLESLCQKIQSYPHSKSIIEDFVMGAVDGSGENPILQQDDVFVYLSIAAGKTYRTQTKSQNKLSAISANDILFRDFIIIRDDSTSLRESYTSFLDRLVGRSVGSLVRESDYKDVFARYHQSGRLPDFTMDSFAMARASQVGTHAYQIRSLAEIGTAVRLLEGRPRYVLLDTSLVYFLLGETAYLPELLKRYLICRANAQGTGVIALSKSHNIPNGDLIGRMAREKMGLKDHWFLRLPSEELGEDPLPFLKEKEVPPKLCVSYLFKFHATSFPMRIDVDAAWWREHIKGNVEAERRLFMDLDYTCHDVRSYGYPYPMHAAHRTASLTKQERKAIRDILLQNARDEGILRGAFLRDPESVHMEGI